MGEVLATLGDFGRTLGDLWRGLGDFGRPFGDFGRPLGDFGRSLGDFGRPLGGFRLAKSGVWAGLGRVWGSGSGKGRFLEKSANFAFPETSLRGPRIPGISGVVYRHARTPCGLSGRSRVKKGSIGVPPRAGPLQTPQTRPRAGPLQTPPDPSRPLQTPSRPPSRPLQIGGSGGVGFGGSGGVRVRGRVWGSGGWVGSGWLDRVGSCV